MIQSYVQCTMPDRNFFFPYFLYECQSFGVLLSLNAVSPTDLTRPHALRIFPRRLKRSHLVGPFLDAERRLYMAEFNPASLPTQHASLLAPTP